MKQEIREFLVIMFGVGGWDTFWENIFNIKIINTCKIKVENKVQKYFVTLFMIK